MSIIPATQESENRRIAVRNQPGEIVHETLSQKYPSQKRAAGVAQGVGPNSNPSIPPPHAKLVEGKKR
jgi:hypothetical protein